MAYPELRMLGRWTHTGTQNASTTWSPAPVLTTEPSLPQGMLTGQQVGEVAYAVTYSPVSASGVADDLAYIQLVLDGQPYPYIYLSGEQATNMAPAPGRIRRNAQLAFGSPTLGRNGQANPPMLATCPKFTQSVTVNAIAGSTAINDDYTVELWGYVYDSQQLASLLPVYAFGPVLLNDPLNHRFFTVPERQIAAAGDWKGNWKKLGGGLQQSTKEGQIHKLIRKARNANATTVSQGYKFQYQNSANSPAVANPWDNLYWDLSADQAIWAERLGVRAPMPTSTGAGLSVAWIDTPGESQTHQHPTGGMPVDFNLNEFNFGQVQGSSNTYDALPALPQGSQLLTKETAFVTVVDNGQSVAANAVTIGFSGVLVETGAGGVI